MENVYERLIGIKNKLGQYKIARSAGIDGFLCKEVGYKSGHVLPEVDETWAVKNSGDTFGGTEDGHFWLYKEIEVPADMLGKNIRLRFNTSTAGWDALNPQFAVYINGKLTQGVDVNHREVKLDENLGKFELYAYCYNGMGAGDNATGKRSIADFKIWLCLNEIDTDVERLMYDLDVPHRAMEIMDEDSREYRDIETYLNNAVNLLDFRSPRSEEFSKSVKAAVEYLGKEFYGKYCREKEETVACIGHTHIDVAWLWTYAQTKEKAQRSFATVLKLMEEYPEYKFMSSQAALYKYVKEEEPELFERIKQRVKEGRWEAEGAMFVEADCNLINGESMVRQIVFGKRFFKNELGADCKILWLPDVFGYSAAMPQILKKCGVNTFVTSKISWNDRNKMPYDIFSWAGIDGSRVFTYFLTAQNKVRDKKPSRFTTYVGSTSPAQVAGTYERLQQKELSREAILTYGFGDGGGGPTREHIEQLRRLSYGVGSVPAAKQKTATEFINGLKARAEGDKRLPTWRGELYLEYHRGTYTSIARNKKNNRKSEFALQKSEMLSVMKNALLGGDYPQKELDDAWEKVLLNQFHDVIPGSSIKEVYLDSDRHYAEVFALTDAIERDVYENIAANIKSDGGLVVFNPHSFAYSGAVKTDGCFVYVENIPAKGYKVVNPDKPEKNKVGKNVLENAFFRLETNEKGFIKSLFDKRAEREVLCAGTSGNRLAVYEDLPHVYDAWEIRPYYTEKSYEAELVSSKPFDEGERFGFINVYDVAGSTVEQKTVMYRHTDRIDFETEVDWRCENMMLRTSFDVDVNTDKATCDIQFGNAERSTHKNTSWDQAKFEVCAHKFVDLSDGGYGMSLLNDCKYGYGLDGSSVSLALLRSSAYPNEYADKGVHKFTYSIYPHKGNFVQSDTYKHAYALNLSPVAVKAGANAKGKLPKEFSLVSCSSDSVIVDTVKRADDGSGVVVRLFESKNARTSVTLEAGFDFTEVALCDMLENEEKKLSHDGRKVALDVKPFEIVTIKFVR